jgi:hypothetical protein
MNLDQHKLEILKLLACFPSTQGWSAEQTALTTAAFLDQTSNFSFEALRAGCRKLGRATGAFPPSAGDLHAACLEAQRRVDWDRAGGKRLDLTRCRLPKPETRGYTPAQLADWTLLINHTTPYTMRADENGDELRIPAGYPGAGQKAEYGYLTPAEAEWIRTHRAKEKPSGFRDAAE